MDRGVWNYCSMPIMIKSMPSADWSYFFFKKRIFVPPQLMARLRKRKKVLREVGKRQMSTHLVDVLENRPIWKNSDCVMRNVPGMESMNYSTATIRRSTAS